MKKGFRWLSLAFVAVCVLVSSCQGPEGPVGPQGPQGVAGGAGSKGDKGDAGVQGPAGNANVQQVTYSAHTHDGINDLLLQLPTSVTADIIKKSAVYVYVQQVVTDTLGRETAYWFPVPGETLKGNQYIYYLAEGGGATASGVFLRRTINFVSGSEWFPGIRVLVVQANTTTSGGRRGAINYQNYEEVRKAFDLPE